MILNKLPNFSKKQRNGALLEGNIVGEVCYCFKARLYADVSDPVERENLVMMENCRSDVLEYVGGEDWV